MENLKKLQEEKEYWSITEIALLNKNNKLAHQIEKLESDKAELLEALEKVIVIQDKYFGEQDIHRVLRAFCFHFESLIQKHKQ